MFSSRKLKIWLLSLSALVVLFVLYNVTSKTPAIKITKRSYEITDFNSRMDSGTGRIGEAEVGNIEEARFETLDRETKEVKRVLGFEKVLHKSGDRWDIDKPFMNIFEEDFRCELTANSGSIQVETVSGQPRPEDAVLIGNVLIHIIPKDDSDIEEGHIYLDDITYDSDRSMFTTPGPVRYVARDAELAGKGLEILYDEENDRLVMLKLIKVDFIHIKSLSKDDTISKSDYKENSQEHVSVATANPSEVAAKKKIIPVASLENIQTQPETAKSPLKPVDDIQKYVCSFVDNVVIEHGQQMVFANEITITGIIFSDKKDKDTREIASVNPSPPPAPVQTSNEPTTRAKVVSKSEVSTVPVAVVPAKKTQTKKLDEAMITCDGPMIVQLAENYKRPGKWKATKKLSAMLEETREKIKGRDVLIAQAVDHNLESEVTEAYGPLEIYFYTKFDEQADSTPARITAKEKASFLPHLNQAIFTGDVIGGMTQKKGYYDEENIFYGQKLTVDLINSQSSSQSEEFGNSEIGHIALSEGDAVILESTRSSGKKILSKTRLASAQLDYDKTANQFIATGQGQIQVKKLDSGQGQNKPCYALMYGFDRLQWNMDSMRIIVDSDTTSGIHIGYMPIIDGRPSGKRTTIDTRHIEVDYTEPVPGRGQLKSLLASGGIVYYEQDKYEFDGERLFYDDGNSLITVRGSEDRLCRLNGVPAEHGIEYNLRTGYAQATIGSGVGTLPRRKE